jgi:SAM-dependent methyltransferase
VNPWRLLYRFGITPWERSEVPRPVVEVADRKPAGRALDIGCGTGRDAVYLANRGWAVTGIDAVPQAIDSARNRSRDDGTDVQWILGDVTALETLGLEGGYGFVLDRGCIHSLSDAGRARCAAGVNALTAAGATLLMFAFQPRRFGLGPRGLTAGQIKASFGPAWEIASVEPDPDIERLPAWVGDARPSWYVLERS